METAKEDRDRFGDDPLAFFRRNIASVRERIDIACRRSGRGPKSVRLLPVTKTVPGHMLRFAFEAGLDSFAENKIQEARMKSEALSDLRVRWNIVGHLQTNKAKDLVRFASEFQALDSLRLAEALERRLESADRHLDVYIQVNTSGEDSKFGLPPGDLIPFIERLREFPRLKPRGLMTLAVFSDDPAKTRPCFRLLRDLRDRAVAIDPSIAGLSMGMSGDFETAIEEGATVVRIGQAIFGRRPTPDSLYWPGFAVKEPR